MSNLEKFGGRSRWEIHQANVRLAVKMRAVEEHTDGDYKKSIISCLKKEEELPMASLLDKIAFELPRLDETSISDFLLNGTYVDRVRLKRILASMIKDGDLKNKEIEGIDLNVYMSPTPPAKDDSNIPDKFLNDNDVHEELEDVR